MSESGSLHTALCYPEFLAFFHRSGAISDQIVIRVPTRIIYWENPCILVTYWWCVGLGRRLPGTRHAVVRRSPQNWNFLGKPYFGQKIETQH